MWFYQRCRTGKRPTTSSRNWSTKKRFLKEEKDILIGLICNEQVIHLIARDKYETDTYVVLENLKAKIREM